MPVVGGLQGGLGLAEGEPLDRLCGRRPGHGGDAPREAGDVYPVARRGAAVHQARVALGGLEDALERGDQAVVLVQEADRRGRRLIARGLGLLLGRGLLAGRRQSGGGGLYSRWRLFGRGRDRLGRRRSEGGGRRRDMRGRRRRRGQHRDRQLGRRPEHLRERGVAGRQRNLVDAGDGLAQAHLERDPGLELAAEQEADLLEHHLADRERDRDVEQPALAAQRQQAVALGELAGQERRRRRVGCHQLRPVDAGQARGALEEAQALALGDRGAGFEQRGVKGAAGEDLPAQRLGDHGRRQGAAGDEEAGELQRHRLPRGRRRPAPNPRRRGG